MVLRSDVTGKSARDVPAECEEPASGMAADPLAPTNDTPDKAREGPGSDQADRSDQPERPDRRDALRKMSGLAAFVEPAMTVLVAGQASAHHRVWHTANCRNFPSSPYCQSPA